jgi:hypothetical protein
MTTDRGAERGLEIWRACCDCCYSLLCLVMRELGEKPLKIRWQHDLDNDSCRGSDGHFSFFHISFFFRMERA